MAGFLYQGLKKKKKKKECHKKPIKVVARTEQNMRQLLESIPCL
jgi:hypothetical protein